MNKTEDTKLFSRKIPAYRTAEVIDIPWEQLEPIGELVFEKIEHDTHHIIEALEPHTESLKSVIDWIIGKREIKKFEELFAPKKKIWPLFLREFDDKPYHEIMHQTRPVTEKTVSDKTNELMRKTVDSAKKIMHTVRVLYRIQTEQLDLLRRYNSSRNNIYFTDFQQGDKKAIRDGRRSTLEYLSYREAAKRMNLWGPIGISEDSYFSNGDLYYTRQLADQLMALCSLKDLDKATFWAVTGTPTIRGTLVGDNEDSSFDEAHFVTVNEYEPGASGRLSTDNTLNEKIYKELQKKNTPRPVEIVNSSNNLQKELVRHIDFVEKQYGKDVLSKHRKFAKTVLDLNYDGIKSYNRAELEQEVKILAAQQVKH